MLDLGEAIVAQIRSDGLADYWPRARLDWFLRTDRRSGRPIGWGAEAVAPGPDAAFDGIRVSVDRTQRGAAKWHWERWRLDAEGAAGNYTAGEFYERGGRVRIREDTSIRLATGKVAVRQEIDGVERHSRGNTPPNYLPEGTIPLARRLIAQQEGLGLFTTIYNVVPPAGRTTTFSPLAFQHAPPIEADPDSVVARVLVLVPGARSALGYVHLLDAEGNTVGVVSGDFEDVRVDTAVVVAVFPEAERQLREVMAATNMPAIETKD